MAYSEDEQLSEDIDWFFTDLSGRMFHAASGGGILPATIHQNDNNRRILRLVQNFPIVFMAQVNENALNIIGYQNQSIAAGDLYFESFMNFAKRGFFSFDNSVLGNFENRKYHKVAKPKNGFLDYFEFTRLTGIELPVIKTEIDIDDYKSFDLVSLV